jgi:hypothetical protein
VASGSAAASQVSRYKILRCTGPSVVAAMVLPIAHRWLGVGCWAGRVAPAEVLDALVGADAGWVLVADEGDATRGPSMGGWRSWDGVPGIAVPVGVGADRGPDGVGDPVDGGVGAQVVLGNDGLDVAAVIAPVHPALQRARRASRRGNGTARRPGCLGPGCGQRGGRRSASRTPRWGGLAAHRYLLSPTRSHHRLAVSRPPAAGWPGWSSGGGGRGGWPGWRRWRRGRRGPRRLGVRTPTLDTRS